MNEREIFAGAMDRASEAERAAFLDSACGGDVALRARVEALLREQGELGSFLESPHAAVAGAAGGVTADATWAPPARASGPTSCWSRSARGAWAPSTSPSRRRPSGGWSR